MLVKKKLQNVMLFHNNRGYIALVSVLLISVVLIVLTVSVSLSGYFTRANVLGSEIKEQSAALAESCVNKAIADIAIGNPTTGTVSFGTNPHTGDPYECEVIEITAGSPNTTIKAKSNFLDVHTNLVVIIDSSDQSVVSWREYATMP